MSLYCAYGSNLNQRQMTRRCPGVKFVGVGKIYGYELCFRGFSDGAYATIVEKDGAFVPAALYEISSENEKALDFYEGYPHQYIKKELMLELGDRTGPAMIYIMDSNKKVGLPSQNYFAKIWDGYCDNGFDTEILKTALENTFRQFYYVDALENPRGSWTFFQ